MPNHRLSIEKRALILAALSEGTPINAICRMFGTGKHAVLRTVEECGEALQDYMARTFVNLHCKRIAMDEQWQYVAVHGQRMARKEAGKGDFWTWGAIDCDTKLAFAHRVGKRTRMDCEDFVRTVRNRLALDEPVQIATDPLGHYSFAIRSLFPPGSYTYGTEFKTFEEAYEWKPSEENRTRKNGIPKVARATRQAVVGSPELEQLTTAHIERLWLSLRQENTRFTRLTLGYSKKLLMHRRSTSLFFGLYNLCRRHKGLDGLTPAQAAGVESDRWTMERVVTMTDAYFAPKNATSAAQKAAERRAEEDKVFLIALGML